MPLHFPHHHPSITPKLALPLYVSKRFAYRLLSLLLFVYVYSGPGVCFNVLLLSSAVMLSYSLAHALRKARHAADLISTTPVSAEARGPSVLRFLTSLF